MASVNKGYLGDGVYIEMVDVGFILTTEDGIAVTNRIVLEMPTMHNLQTWIEGQLVMRGELIPRSQKP